MAAKSGIDRKEQIVSAAIDRLYAVGFEGFRVGDVAKDVGINNATLIHHYKSKVALIKAVVEHFTQRFEAVADATDSGGTPRARFARHMNSSVALMRTAPEMFVVLNEIMVRARRDADIAQLVAVPLQAWKRHIVSLISSPSEETEDAEEIATACMSQLLGMGLLLNAVDRANLPVDPDGDRTAPRAITALSHLVKETE
jgi:AcrR family transcriptional regulator